jgi:hypothetical protein
MNRIMPLSEWIYDKSTTSAQSPFDPKIHTLNLELGNLRTIVLEWID